MGLFSSIKNAVSSVGSALSSPVTSLIGGLAGAGASYLGQQSTNKANKKLAREQMDFQEQMRATQYQTTMADMAKAGLNPILAYKQGGAGNLSGASAQMQNPAAAGMDAFQKGTNSAIAAQQNRLALETMENQSSKLFNESQAARWAQKMTFFDKEVREKMQPALIHQAKFYSDNPNLYLLKQGLPALQQMTGAIGNVADLVNPISKLGKIGYKPKKTYKILYYK